MSPLVETTNPSVWISGNAGLVEVVVVRRKRKRLALVVETDGEVQCRIPSRCAQRTAETFIFAHQDWILRTIARMKDRVGRPRPQYAEGAAHYFLGQRYQLETCQNLQSKAQVSNSALLVRAASDDPTQIQKRLEDWYRTQADLIFNQRLSALVECFSLQMASSLKVRKMKAKWGSCSQSGVITLNLWLITQDIKAIDYVILHELCHLKHFDHTPAFYAYLAEFMPDWRARKALLV